MQKVIDFLSDARVFFFGTVDGNKPEVRPFGFQMAFGGKLYIGMGKHKEVYRQTMENPNVILCAMNANNEWIRIRGKAVPETDPAAYEAAFEKSPNLARMYSKESGLEFGLVYLSEGSAEFNVRSGQEIIQF